MSWMKEPIDPRTNGIRVLIVDNDPRICEQHTTLLSSWGYIPVLAEGIGDALLKDAVNRAQTQRCHIALVDKRLRDDDNTRDWSGLKLVREFASPTLAIIVSGSGERKPAVEALTKYGAVAFVGKEDGPEALHDTIAEVIAKHTLGVRIEQITWPYSVNSAKIVTELVGDDPTVPADEADEVISRLFTHSTHVSLEPLSSGNQLWKSSDHIRRRSLVFRANIDHNPAPLVVKLARRHKIEEELTNYQAFVRDKLRAGFRPELRAHTLLWDIGGVAYTYIGLDDPSTSDWPKTFAAYYRATERPDEVVKPLRSFFNADNWGYWYDVDVSVAKRTLFEAYDQSWKGRFSKRISEWSKHTHWLAFPGLPLKLPNPMRWLTGHAHTSGHIVTAREAVTHGDLHGDNLFIDAQGNAWPIDFARTGRGPILRDFVEIIHDIVTRLAQIELANGQQFYNLAIALCQPLKPNQKMSLTTEIQQSPETLKAFEVAQELLQLTHTRTHYRDRRELLWGLLLNSMFVTSILSKDHPRYDKSLLLGSVICERLEHWGSDWPPPDWPAVIWQEPLSQEDVTMPTNEEINHQRELLTINRGNLAHYLKQQTLLGEAHTPPGVINGILEARANIRHIKGILRGWGVPVADEPDDEPSTNQQPQPAPAGARSEDRPVDFVIGAALEEELDAVLAQLPGFRQLDPSHDDIRTYYAAQVPVTFPSGATDSYEVRVLLLGKGQEEATLAAADALRRWKPGYMLIIGIAGGVAANGVNLGDVLIADQIVGYELQKQTAKRVDVRWNVHQVNKSLVLFARNVRGNDWQQLVTKARPEPGEPQRHIGPIASGNKVIAYAKVVDRYRDIWSQLIGVEMEAAGVAAAAFQQAQPTRFFMIRSVSDLADEAKDLQEVKRWRAYACDVAAAYAIALLKRGPIALTV